MLGTDELLVLIFGIAAIIWVNWYFFLAGRGAGKTAVRVAGMQEIEIEVDGGYEPATIRAASGSPLRLIFNRVETSGCSEEVVFPDFSIRRFLPAFEHTAIEIGPREPGEYEFTCGMGMLRGKLIIEGGDDGNTH